MNQTKKNHKRNQQTFEVNENENTTDKNVWDAGKQCFERIIQQ